MAHESVEEASYHYDGVTLTRTMALETTSRRIAIAGLTALAVAIGIGRFAFTPLLPMMQADFGISIAEGGWLASANYAGYLLGALSAMVLRLRPASAIRGGLLGIAGATLAVGLTESFAGWFVLRFIAGIASAWVLIHVSAWALERLASARRPLLSGAVFAGVGTGILAVGIIFVVLARTPAGSADAWIGLGILSLIATAAMWNAFSAGGSVTEPGPDAPRSSRPPGWHGEAVRFVFSYAALGFGYIIPATFLPAMAREVVRDPAVFSWSWPVFGAAAALSTLAASWLTPWAGSRALWTASLFVMAFGVALPVVAPGLSGILVSALLVGGTFMVATMTGLKEGRELGGTAPTALMAAMTAAFALGQIVGPLTVGHAKSAAYAAPLLIACAVLLAGACVLLRRPRAARVRQRPAPKPAPERGGLPGDTE